MGGNALWRLRRTSRKARHRKIETAPKKMYRARFAHKARAKFGHYPIDLHQHPPEFLHIDRIVLGVRAVLLERNGVLDLARHGPDMNVDAKATQPRHDLGVEVGHRHRLERKTFGAAVAGFDNQPVAGEIEN